MKQNGLCHCFHRTVPEHIGRGGRGGGVSEAANIFVVFAAPASHSGPDRIEWLLWVCGSISPRTKYVNSFYRKAVP